MELDVTLPARWYNDPDIWQRERWPIFGCNWVHVAYDHQLRNTGDYVTENLAGWPMFIRRNEDRTLAAFLNLCPHRAGPLVFEGSGCTKNLVCKYHGWAFNADGTKFAAVSSLDGKGEVRVYDTASGAKVVCEKVTGPAYAVSWHPDGKTVASAGFDGTVWLHDPTTGKLLRSIVVLPKK